MRNRFRIPVSLLTLFLLLFTLIVPATAAVDPSLTEAGAVQMLQTYGIVRGDPNGNLGLGDRLTRAQAAAVFVRSMGFAELSAELGGSVPFIDAQGHWGANEIAMAARLGLMRGDGDGTFRPNADITYAEVLTVLLRMAQQEPTGQWSPGLIAAAASRFGIVPSGVDVTAPAIRGKIFWSLAAAISGIPLATGKTVLQTYVDTRPPVLTLHQSSMTTSDPTVTVSGTAQDAVRVLVDGKPANLSGGGAFTATANVSTGSNVLTVEAFDLAQNRAAATVTVERRGAISRLEITGPVAVRINSTAKLEIKAFDSSNREVSLDGVQYAMTGNVATFDPASATVRAGNTKGQATLTATAGSVRKSFTFSVVDLSDKAQTLRITEVNGGHAPVPGKEATVKVQVLDENDRLVTDDYARNVTLAVADLSGVSINTRTVPTEAGVATFTIKAVNLGTGTLTATSSGLTTHERPLQVLTAPRVALTTSALTLRADGSSTTTVRAELQDENGQVLRNNSQSDLVVDIANAVTDGALSTNTLTIRSGSTTSSTATFRAGLRVGTEVITGQVVSGNDYPVQSAVLPIIGGSGVKLVVQGPTTNQTPGGAPVTINVRVLDSKDNVVTTGSYAFQITLTTSNGEPVTNGLPAGVDLVVNGTSYRPVSPGNTTAGDNYIVARTYQGVATLKLSYNKSGTVKLTPRLVDATNSAYHNTVGFGPAASSLGMTAVADEVNFAGTPSAIKLTADSALGSDLPGAAAGTSSRQITIRARVLDRFGANVPGNRSEITLTRTSGDGVSRLSGTNNNTLRKTAVDGEVEFTVQTTSTPGYDVYTASSGSLTAGTITVAVRNAVASQPLIGMIRGVKDGDPSPENRYVAPDDDYMQIQLETQLPPDTGEPTHWAVAKVWRQGQSTPIMTGIPVDLSQMAPTILIPKSKVPAGTYVYEVAVNTGYGDSQRSPDHGGSTATSAVYNTAYKISAAQYDAGTGKLVLSTSSLPANAVVDKAKITLVKGNRSLLLNQSAVTATASGSSITINLGDAAQAFTPDVFNGEVLVNALDGWVTTADGAQIAKADRDTPIKPMPYITSASVDVSRSTLTLNGAGLNHAPIAVDLIQVHDGADTVALTPGTTGDRPGTASESQVTITLSRATLDKIKALGAGVTLNAELGWMKAGTTAAPFRAAAIDDRPVYFKQEISSAAYDKATNTLTLNASGFTGAALDPTKLLFKYSGMAPGTDWRPTSSAQVAVVSDSKITIHFSDSEASAFETKFLNRNVYLNTQAGWLSDAQGHEMAPLTTNSVTFYVR